MGSPPRLRPGTAPQTLRTPPHGGRPVLRSSVVAAPGPPWLCPFRLRARLGISIPATCGRRGITPAFGYGPPHPGAGGTSTLLTSALPGAYGPLRHPDRPDLTLAGCPLARATPPAGLPVLRPLPPSTRAIAITPAGTGRCSRRSLPDRLAAFPVLQAGRLPHPPFRGLRSVHVVTARAVAEPPKAALCRRSASADVVASIVRPDCYRLERQLPGGIRTR